MENGEEQAREPRADILEIFEKVNLITPIEQRRFFNFLEDTVTELESLYNGYVFDKDTVFAPPASLADENVVLPLYHNAIVDNIIFLENGEETRKSEFIRKSRNAYLKYWNEAARGRKMRKREW